MTPNSSAICWSPIESYVDWIEYQTSQRVHERLVSEAVDDEDLPLVVATSELYGAVVKGIRLTDEDNQSNS